MNKISMRTKLIIILVLAIVAGALWAFGKYRGPNFGFEAETILNTVQAKQADSMIASMGMNANGVLDDSHFKNIDDTALKNIWLPKIRALGIRNYRVGMGVMGTGTTSFKRYAETLSSLSNPTDGSQPIRFNMGTPSAYSTGASSPTSSCFLVKMKLFLQGGSTSNCGSEQNVTVNAKVKIDFVENLNEWDHCASYKTECQVDGKTWYERRTAQKSDWVAEVADTAKTVYSKLQSDPVTASLPMMTYSAVHDDAYTKAPVENWDGNSYVTVKDSSGNIVYRDVPTTAASLGSTSVQYAKYGNTHQYCGTNAQSKCVPSQITSSSTFFNPLPLVMTEFGWSTNNVSEKVQAKYLTRGFFANFESGLVKSYAFTIRDRLEQGSNTEKYFGIVKDDGTPKVAYNWLKNMISILQDPGASFTPGQLTYNASTTTSGARLTQYVYQKRDGSFWIVLYNDVQSSTDSDANAATTLTFGQAMDVSVYDPSVGTVSTQTFTNTSTAAITVPDRVLIVRVVPTGTSGSTDTGGGTNTGTGTGSGTVTPVSMHIGDIDAATQTRKGNYWRVNFTVRAENADHQAIANATVKMIMSRQSNGGASNTTMSCVTSTSGTCSVTTGWDKQLSSVTLNITDITYPTMTYDATMNHDPDGSSNGTTMSVSR